MSKSEVLTLVSDLALGADNSTETSIIYDEVVRELGFLEVLTGTETISTASGTATYQVANDNVQSLEYHSSQGVLTQAEGTGLASVFGASWRNRTGTPLAVTTDMESREVFRLVPIPDFADNLTIIRTEFRQDVPEWMEIAIAFEVLSREFSRESDHQDMVFAETCRAFAGILFNMLGIEYHGTKGN